MKLYEITREYRELCDSLELAESGEVPEGTADLFAGLCDRLDAKAKAIVCLIRELSSESDAVKSEAQRLSALAQIKANSAARLKAYLLECLLAAKIDSMDVGVAKLRVGKAPRPSISWPDDKPIPEAFAKQTVSLDGAKAYEAHKAGELPEGFTVKTTIFLSIR